MRSGEKKELISLCYVLHNFNILFEYPLASPFQEKWFQCTQSHQDHRTFSYGARRGFEYMSLWGEQTWSHNWKAITFLLKTLLWRKSHCFSQYVILVAFRTFCQLSICSQILFSQFIIIIFPVWVSVRQRHFSLQIYFPAFPSLPVVFLRIILNVS